MNETEQDKRYRILVVLTRSDRPITWRFHCPKCQEYLGEVVNAEIDSVSDVMDLSDGDLSAVGHQCRGRNPYWEPKGRCNMWVYFSFETAA